MLIRLALPLVASLLFAGCAADNTRYPSLVPRAAEKVGFGEPSAPAPVTATTDPALDRRIAEAGARLDKISASFEAAAAIAQREANAARGRAAGSERWIEAQTALATLDDLRAQTSSAMTDLDQLTIARNAALAPTYPALDAVLARAATLLDAQTKRITALAASLAPA